MSTVSLSTASLASPGLEFGAPPAAGSPRPEEARGTSDRGAASPAWFPPEPRTLQEAGLDASCVEGLALKMLSSSGQAPGRKIADQLRLPFGLVAEVLRGLKNQLLVGYKRQAAMGDYDYELTEEGQKKARWETEQCTYCGAAPVPLSAYVASVEQQSVRRARPKLSHVIHALSELTLPPSVISQVGQAIYSGKALFLYGQPGNGKSSIALRAIRALSQDVWIPRTMTVTSEIIRLFDPANHEESPLEGDGRMLDNLHYDRRWVRIRRPCIVVGGELKLEQLEISSHESTGIIEAPLQLKANCGALVVDDFGRQRCSTEELLNRWIVPLERGHDYLRLPSGRQIQVPFDQLIIFSTNVEPRRLVDDAFLRRIPYKVELSDPSPREFRTLVNEWCGRLGIRYDEGVVDELIARHFVDVGRPLRYCQPRDLMQQVQIYCEFHDLPLVLTSKAVDVAVRNYFAGL
jgi:predicted ATPase with chaperone activity